MFEAELGLLVEGTLVWPSTEASKGLAWELEELEDPELMPVEVKSVILSGASPELISLTEVGSILQPVDIKSVNSNGLLLPVDDNSLVETQLFKAPQVADGLVGISPFNYFNCVFIQLAYSSHSPIVVAKMLNPSPLCCLSPIHFAKCMLSRYIFEVLESEWNHLGPIYINYNN